MSALDSVVAATLFVGLPLAIIFLLGLSVWHSHRKARHGAGNRPEQETAAVSPATQKLRDALSVWPVEQDPLFRKCRAKYPGFNIRTIAKSGGGTLHIARSGDIWDKPYYAAASVRSARAAMELFAKEYLGDPDHAKR